MIIQQYEVWYTLTRPSPKFSSIRDENFQQATLWLEFDDKGQVPRATFDGRHVGAWQTINHDVTLELYVAEPTGALFRQVFIDSRDWGNDEFPEWLYLSGNNEYLWLEDGGASASIYGISTGWGSRVELNGFGFIRQFPEGIAGWLEAQKWCLQRMMVTVDKDEE